ncbi:unnamed protein product [Timema podura]|uniref:Uncharacterized protein n=1 Tax=Timema podura TaxID=61482 RepID=A0ABN7NTB6_TIMPD|nr:unnamed protein product [Timema podura]
MWCLYKCLW